MPNQPTICIHLIWNLAICSVCLQTPLQEIQHEKVDTEKRSVIIFTPPVYLKLNQLINLRAFFSLSSRIYLAQLHNLYISGFIRNDDKIKPSTRDKINLSFLVTLCQAVVEIPR